MSDERDDESHRDDEEIPPGQGGLVSIGEPAEDPVFGPGEDDGPEVDPSQPGMVNIRDISIKCGQCGTYQTLTAFARRDDWNVYTYECENDVCDPQVTRTLVEVPEQVDAFARRDPGWRGGRVHGGGDG